jgi:hypothetical protein
LHNMIQTFQSLRLMLNCPCRVNENLINLYYLLGKVWVCLQIVRLLGQLTLIHKGLCH